MANRVPLVAGNWKMHGSRAFADELVSAIVGDAPEAVELAVFPPFPYLATLGAERRGRLALGGQDLSARIGSGAFTGEVSGAMLADVGCRYALAGHSERRQYHAETDALVAEKAAAAIAAGLVPVVCLGENLAQRQDGNTAEVLRGQLAVVLDRLAVIPPDGLVLAYEPVWAIGTGQTASPAQVQEVHGMLRSQLAARDATLSVMTRIVYGGSVKPDNAAELFSQPDVDGGLIGGASLQAADFLAIARAAC